MADQQRREPGERIAIPCACGCRLPAAYVLVIDGRLVLEIAQKHFGERHVTRVRLGELSATLNTQHPNPDSLA